MKLICEGKKTKDAVLNEVVDVYLRAFEIAAGSIDIFVTCFSEYMTQVSAEVCVIQ